MPAAQLASFYNEAKLKAAARPAAEAEERRDRRGRSRRRGPARPHRRRPWSTPSPGRRSSGSRCTSPTREWGFGSGTIIYSTAEESIILTCAHIFRVKGQQQPSPKNFRVPISVDLFDGQFVRPPAGDARLHREGPPRRGDRLRLHQRRRPDPDQARPQARPPRGWSPPTGSPEGDEDVHRGLLARQRRHRLEHDDPRPPGRHEQHPTKQSLRHDQVRLPAQGRPVGRRPLHLRRLRRGRLRLRRPQRARRPLRRARGDPPAARPQPVDRPLQAPDRTAATSCSLEPGPGQASPGPRSPRPERRRAANPEASPCRRPTWWASPTPRPTPTLAIGARPERPREGAPPTAGPPRPPDGDSEVDDTIRPGTRPGGPITTDLGDAPAPAPALQQTRPRGERPTWPHPPSRRRPGWRPRPPTAARPGGRAVAALRAREMTGRFEFRPVCSPITRSATATS